MQAQRARCRRNRRARQVAGRPGSAIFQLGSSSTNALVGELIGSSGWRLVATATDSAVIERGGVQRRIAISNGF